MEALITWPIIDSFPVLSVLTATPLLAMQAVLLSKKHTSVLLIALLGAGLVILQSFFVIYRFNPNDPGVQFLERFQFAGMSYCVGVDGVNLLFMPLIAVLTALALVYTTITRAYHDKSLIACLLALEAVSIGSFTALNLMQFWLWQLVELIPVVIITLNKGTGQLRRTVTALFLQYWVSSLLLVLAGFLFLAFGLVGTDRALSFDWLSIKNNNDYLHDEVLVFILLFFGFSIRMPLFPFHGWLPLIAAQGTVASGMVFIVGLNIGFYAILRFILPILPGVAENWSGYVSVISLLGLVYGAFLAMMQINIRRLLAFIVVSHNGLLMMGAFSFNKFGLEGSVLLCQAYGLAMTGLLFAVGIIYSRTSTAFTPRLGGFFDSKPTVALLFMLSALSTTAIPGTPGFDAAHLLIEGIIEENGWLMTSVALLGNLMAATCLLRAFLHVFIAPSRRYSKELLTPNATDIKERSIFLAISVLLIGTGFYTTPWLKMIDEGMIAIEKSFLEHGTLEAVDPATSQPVAP